MALAAIAPPRDCFSLAVPGLTRLASGAPADFRAGT